MEDGVTANGTSASEDATSVDAPMSDAIQATDAIEQQPEVPSVPLHAPAVSETQTGMQTPYCSFYFLLIFNSFRRGQILEKCPRKQHRF
jgi:hypothetical protein